MPRTWILTGSPENHAATRAHDFTVIGLKERNRNRALEIEPGDRITIWPGKPGKADPYPWRFPTSPEVVLDESDWIPAEGLDTMLTAAGARA